MTATTVRPTGTLLRAEGPVAPLIKWPGGKRSELANLSMSWPTSAGRFLEPFVGGGAALMATAPDVPAEVNDASEDLVALYTAVKQADPAVFAWLGEFAGWWDRLGELDDLVNELAEVHVAADDPQAMALRVLARHDTPLRQSLPTLNDDLADLFRDELVVGVPRKLRRMRRVQDQRQAVLSPADVRGNVEGALRAAAYTTVRAIHNEERRSGRRGTVRVATFAVLRELAYAAMFRFNGDGDFNVPYGGMSYNGRDLTAKLGRWAGAEVGDRLATTTLHGGDFADFFERVAPCDKDFMFLDPPYLSDFRDYDGNGFGPDDHRRLAACLRATSAHFQLVIKATPEVRDWYGHGDWQLREVDKTYAWTIKGRNDRNTTHLVIENR